jgi:protein involved in polysaccharide export with SLBB domain
MKKRLSFLLSVILGVGLLTTSSMRAQQTSKTSPQATEVRPVSCLVIGAVRSPGRFELRRSVRLSEVLALVGGVTRTASGVINVIHTERRRAQNGNVPSDLYKIADLKNGGQKSNPQVEAGDIVIVTELDPIFVTGAVANQREIYFNQPLTLTEVLKLAGGVRADAKTSKVIIHRQKKNAAGISIEVDLEMIKKHRVEDPILQPFDIIEVSPLGPRKVGPPLLYPTFDSRPLIPPVYRVIY